jgi:outer membrane protein OmpA-like peptidoglycan-associated protein
LEKETLQIHIKPIFPSFVKNKTPRQKRMKQLTLTLFTFLFCSLTFSQDLTGRWEGGLPQDDKDFTFELEADIVQRGNVLSGNMQITAPESGEFVIQKFSGTFIDSIFKLSEYEIVNSFIKPTNSFGWCLKNLVGKISIDEKKMSIEGTWSSNETWFPDTKSIEAGNCAPGKFILTKKIPKDDVAQPIVINEKIRFKNVLFKVSTANLLPESYKELNHLSKYLIENPNYRVKIDGHTDKVGSGYENLILSKKRAEAVRAYLIKKGINTQRISTEGYGDKINICPPKCRENRRVEFTIKQK